MMSFDEAVAAARRIRSCRSNASALRQADPDRKAATIRAFMREARALEERVAILADHIISEAARRG
jgi:hypothetical protein